MDWKRPMMRIALLDFTFKPDGDKNVVTWSMQWTNNFMRKLFSMVMDTDKMCGPQCEKALADLGKMAAAR